MIEIIPAIDIMDGQVVRLQRGDFQQRKVYDKTPVELARMYEDAGFRRLHVVDLDGARRGKPENFKTLKNITEATNLLVDFGGGVRDVTDVQNAFAEGAAYLSVGSAAVSTASMFSLWMEQFGAEKFILAADVKDGKVALRGWQDVSDMEPGRIIRGYLEQGIKQVMSTDISRDGTLQGVAVESFKKLKDEFPQLTIIASGGISSVEDLYKLDDAGVDAVVVGKALLEGRIRMEELTPFLNRQNP